MTPGMMAKPSGRSNSLKTTHSCSCLGLAPSKEIAPTFAFSATSMISRERNVQVVRAFVVTPAHMEAHPISRNVPQGMIQGGHMQLGDLLELLCAQVGKPVVAAHAQVGAVHLKHKAGSVDGVVFLFQGVCQNV